MPVNDKQKVVLLDINADTLQLIRDKLLEGYVILNWLNLQPAQAKILILYATPAEI
jgi:hypothetical protein